MPKHAVWIEGVDLEETLFDTDKLSIVRGASRALEEMPPLALAAMRSLDDHVQCVALGASQAGIIVDAETSAIEVELCKLMRRLATQGIEPDFVENVAKATSTTFTLDMLATHAPFAHLIFHHAVVTVISPAGDAEVALAIERARAQVRVAQLREPGKRLGTISVAGTFDTFCEYDRVRTAEVEVEGPPKRVDQVEKYSIYRVSRSSGARWQFGRALRQRLYERARVELAEHANRVNFELAFVDDFHELVGAPRPKLPPANKVTNQDSDLPLSLANKIAVFTADGDKFGALRNKLRAELGAARGLEAMTTALKTNMDALLRGLILELAAMRDHRNPNISAAAALELTEKNISFRGGRRKLGDRLLRFETLLYGGDDMTFVVPAWLGWWLAMSFFRQTSGWNVAGHDMLFSAGLVFASYKTPIRALRTLALELCQLAKASTTTAEAERGVGGAQSGGLEIEVLESIDPPAEGIGRLRERLLGKQWCIDTVGLDGSHKVASRLFVPRGDVTKTYRTLRNAWVDEPWLPPSQAHRAFQRAREAGEVAGGKLTCAAAASAAEKLLERYAKRTGRSTPSPLDAVQLLPNAGGDTRALRLHFLLQQHDYIVGAGPWTEGTDDNKGSS